MDNNYFAAFQDSKKVESATKNFLNTNDFRKNATNEDVEDFLKYILDNKGHINKAFPCTKYNFSDSSAKNIVAEIKGKKEPPNHTRTVATSKAKKFEILNVDENAQFIQRSFKLTDQTYSKYEQFLKNHRQYKKQVIFDKLLNDILEQYL